MIDTSVDDAMNAMNVAESHYMLALIMISGYI